MSIKKTNTEDINFTGKISFYGEEFSIRKADNQSDSTATTVGELVNDFNSLLQKLKDADLMM